MNAEALEFIHSLQEKNEELQRQIESLTCEKNEVAQKNEQLVEQINDLLRRLYGRKSERFENPNQSDLLKLLDWPEESTPAEEKPAALEHVEYRRRRPQKPGPKPLPEHLPRIVVAVDPPEEKRVCACCSKDMERVDEVITEELDVVPPEFRVKQYVQGKYRCRGCMNRDLVKPLPPRPIKKGRPSPSLLAYIVVSKYVDHTPLYRQEQIFKRHGLHLSRSTMDEWLGQMSALLQPIVETQKRWLLGHSYLQVDETPIQVQDREKKGSTHRGYLWAYCLPRGEVVYDFTKTRSGRGPQKFLEDYSGHLQADGYPGFRELFRSGRITHIACMAHVRRKFVEAKHALPERVEEILELVRELYAIESEAKELELTAQQRRQVRQERSAPILEVLRAKIEELRPIPVPKSKLGRAVEYALEQWEPMLRYLDVGESEIDNNSCERAIRPVVLGRKNFLFLGSAKGGGERAEVFYSLLQSCRRLGVEPFAYLEDVLGRVATHEPSRLGELTPRGWKEKLGTSEKPSSRTDS